jgi:hypothetical protein
MEHRYLGVSHGFRVTSDLAVTSNGLVALAVDDVPGPCDGRSGLEEIRCPSAVCYHGVDLPALLRGSPAPEGGSSSLAAIRVVPERRTRQVILLAHLTTT